MIDWIDVKDRLPETFNVDDNIKRSKQVLVIQSGDINIGILINNEWKVFGKFSGLGITHWAEINLPDKKQEAEINYDKLKTEYNAIKDMYSRACDTIQSVIQEKHLGLGSENIFELAANYIRNETDLAQYGKLQELLRILGWQGGTIHQVLDVLRKAVVVAKAHKEAEISGDWDVFKAEMYALRYVIGK